MEPMTTLFTRADYVRLPEGFRAELLEGALVRDASPTYGHQTLATLIQGACLPLVGPRRVLQAPLAAPTH